MKKGFTKQDLLDALIPVVQMTRGGEDVIGMKLVDDETVEVQFPVGCRNVNVAGDSGLSMIRDICWVIM